jgi:transposase
LEIAVPSPWRFAAISAVGWCSPSGEGEAMFFPESTLRVHIYEEPVDMRKSFDGLYALVRHRLALDPLSGALFVFIRRRGSQMKVLY